MFGAMILKNIGHNRLSIIHKRKIVCKIERSPLLHSPNHTKRFKLSTDSEEMMVVCIRRTAQR